MLKFNNKGFVLAETLVVTVFLMVIFGMLYSNFYPLIGEYEKRETYDDVDSKYAVYWLKRMIEDNDYKPSEIKKLNLKNNKFMRFECSDIQDVQKRATCVNLLDFFEVEGCDDQGKNCYIFITSYEISGFKETVENKFARYKEDCNSSLNTCKNNYVDYNVANDRTGLSLAKKEEKWREFAEKSVFNSGMEDYIFYLPNYKNNPNDATYRVIASFQHRKDNNDYYSYATIEVNR